MRTNPRASPPASAPEIADLGLLSSETRIIEALREIAGVFGNTLSVTAMPATADEPSNDYRFLIHFAQAKDAVAAAKTMKCQLCGFSTLLVTIPRQHGAA